MVSVILNMARVFKHESASDAGVLSQGRRDASTELASLTPLHHFASLDNDVESFPTMTFGLDTESAASIELRWRQILMRLRAAGSMMVKLEVISPKT